MGLKSWWNKWVLGVREDEVKEEDLYNYTWEREPEPVKVDKVVVSPKAYVFGAESLDTPTWIDTYPRVKGKKKKKNKTKAKGKSKVGQNVKNTPKKKNKSGRRR
jgi:hypothetical protein